MSSAPTTDANPTFKRAGILRNGGIVVPHIAEDCRIALDQIGVIAFDLRIKAPRRGALADVKDEVAEYINEIKPDFLFTVDGGLVRDEPEFFAELGIPVVAWFVDDPMGVMGPHNVFDKLLIFTWDRAFIEPLRAIGCKLVEYLPLGVNPARFRRVPPEDPKCAPFRCDVSFVGSSLISNLFRAEFDSLENEKLKSILNECIERHAPPPHPPVAKLLADAERRAGAKVTVPCRRGLEEHIAVEAMLLYRKRALARLARFVPHIYGDDGWNSILPPGAVFRGQVDYLNDLKYLYSSSKINLNLSKSQLITSVNQRVFDAPACGGFVLTDYREDTERLFDTDEEIAVFHDYAEMEQKVEYFLENNAERENRARMTKRRVLGEHTYAHRMKKMLETIKDYI
jgi:spore maturation protein CgeB